MASRSASVALAYLTTYVVAMVLGLDSVLPGTGLAFFWPATGVAALWLLRGRTRDQVLLDGALLLAATVIVDALHDITLLGSALFGVANLVIALVVRLASARTEALSFWGPLPRSVSRKRDVRMLLIASFAAAVASLPFALLATYVETGGFVRGAGLAWVVRNTCSTFVVVASVLALLTALFRAHARRGWAARLTSEPRPHWQLELVAAASVSLGAAAVLFGSNRVLPIAFMLIVAATWIGYRFSPAVGGVYSLILSTLAVLCTQAGRGPFAGIDDLLSRSVVVQIYVLVTTVLVLVISLGVAERAALLARVVDSEARASSRAELLDAVLGVMTDGLVVLEASGQPLMRNAAAEALMGPRRRPGQDGPADYGLFRPDGTPIDRDELPHVRALAGEAVSAEDVLRIDPGTGEQSTLSVGAVPLHTDDDGTMAVVVIHDVTQERTHRRELQAFAGTVAHDLKAPLTGVGSWAEILGDQLDALGVDVTGPRSSLRRIESSSQRMEQLISDLLSYSQAQSATLTPVSLSLTGMVESVARDLREAGGGWPPLIEHGPLGRVLADRTLVGQLLANVLGNAVKYVEPGTRPHVRVTSELIGDVLEVRVADNGIGIPRAERGRIFDSFYRASSSGSFPGTGLGLAICARAVDRHGGRISAREGIDGRGTTLVFTLPADLDWKPGDQEPGDQEPGDTTSAEPPPRRTGSATAVS